ncbi:MAG: metal-dependent transcriptional regulator [Chloroflexi bacterium]|nr:metal-dependent transcriptional regulator [Chloroflexota bacterium]
MCPTVWFYLAEIYRILDREPIASLSLVAEGMGVSLQATSRMIRRMVESEYVEHEPYKGVTLTSEGKRIALQMIRRHRILEVYLHKVMGFGWDEVHALCDSLEKGVEDKLIARMNEMAGYPTHCPHGEPIPSKKGVMPILTDQPLVRFGENSAIQVTRVKAHEPEKLRYLAEKNLRPGTSVIVLSHGPFQGPVYITVDQEHHVIGHQIASEVYAQPAP